MTQEFAGIPLEKTLIIGIINLSPETFYKGSLTENQEETIERAQEMVEEGAQIIDLGGMSTGPNVDPISVKEEKQRLLPPVKALQNNINVPVSVDTQRSEVAEEALEAGADIINDVSGFKADPEMAQVAANHDCPAILMASGISGRIRTAEKNAKDIQTIEQIKEALEESLEICKNNGVKLEKVAIDPAIGFGKGHDWDLKVIAELDKLSSLGRPICVGISRKSFTGKVLNLDDPKDRLFGSLGATAIAVINGAKIVRTHDPKETNHTVRIIEEIQEIESN